MLNKNFKIETEDWTKINLENAKFILEQGKEFEKYLVEASEKITSRAFTILGILIPIVAALIAFTVSEYVNKTIDKEYFVLFLCFLIIAILFVIGKLALIIFPRTFMPFGRNTKELCVDEFLIDSPGSPSFLAMLLNEIETSQYKIDKNKIQNRVRTEKLKDSLLYLFIIVICSCLILLFVLY